MNKHIGKELVHVPVQYKGGDHRQVVKPFLPNITGNQEYKNIKDNDLDRKTVVGGVPKAAVQYGGLLHIVNVSIG